MVYFSFSYFNFHLHLILTKLFMSEYHCSQKDISIVITVKDLIKKFVILHKFVRVISSIDNNRQQFCLLMFISMHKTLIT